MYRIGVEHVSRPYLKWVSYHLPEWLPNNFRSHIQECVGLFWADGHGHCWETTRILEYLEIANSLTMDSAITAIR